tara:strand:- start:170 stop:1477 length:1308 start_codon:yes stop_codon:yes gene_type:complete
MLKSRLYILFFLFPCIIFSQFNTTSPYSFYGIGNLHQTGLSQNIFMGGISNALNDTENLNFQNPASYSFLNLTSVELAFQLSHYNMKQSDLKKTDLFSNIIGLGIGFPLSKNASISLGFRPHSSIGYNIEYSSFQSANKLDLGEITYNFSGNGGLNKAILGAAYKFNINKGLSISTGFNLNYYFGTISRINAIEIDSTGFNNYRENLSTLVRDFQLNYGLIIDKTINDKKLSVGFVFSPESQLKSTENLYSHTYTLSGQYEYFGDTIYDNNQEQGFMELPVSMSAGINLYKQYNWLIGCDYNYTNWDNYKLFNNSVDYIDNLHEFIIGGYFTPKFDDIHNYWSRVQYRLGFSYSSGYLNLNNFELAQSSNVGLLKDYKISFGLGMPIPKNKSQFNLGLQFGYRGSSESILIDEKYINFIFSMTFNDKWFKKRKID